MSQFFITDAGYLCYQAFLALQASDISKITVNPCKKEDRICLGYPHSFLSFYMLKYISNG